MLKNATILAYANSEQERWLLPTKCASAAKKAQG